MKRCFLRYPCGKELELRVPITTIDDAGNNKIILPNDVDYFIHAKKKFQINDLKIVEKDIVYSAQKEAIDFVSLGKKVRSIE
jgi:hypothetical protein